MAIGLATGLSLGGKVLGFFGQKKQQKANDRAMEEAQAAQSQYDAEVAAWEQQQRDAQHAHAAAAHARAMEQFNKERAAELNVLKNQGATDAELAQHDSAMREMFMAEAEAFNFANYRGGVKENQAQAREQGSEALAEYREGREAPNTEGKSEAFQKAAAAAIRGADHGANVKNKDMAKLTGRTRGRQGEEVAARNLGTQGAAGSREAQYIQKMGDMRGRRLGYVAPMAPTGPGPKIDYSTRPEEPEMEIQTSSSGNALAGLGQAMGSAGSWLGGGHMGPDGWTSNASAAKGWLGMG